MHWMRGQRFAGPIAFPKQKKAHTPDPDPNGEGDPPDVEVGMGKSFVFEPRLALSRCLGQGGPLH